MDSVIPDESTAGLMGVMKDLAFSLPGVDEAMSFAQVMKYALDAYVT